MTPRVSDEFHALVINFHRATANFNATPKADENAEANTAFNDAIKAVETTELVATTYEGAIAALRAARSEIDDFSSSELVKPLVRGALAFFENLEDVTGDTATHAMNMVSGLSLDGITRSTEWLAIYDAVNAAEEIVAAFYNRPACVTDGDIRSTPAGDYIDTIGEFLVWERIRIADAMRVALENTQEDPELLHKAILAHDVKYSEFGFEDISAQVAAMSARYEAYKAGRASR